MGKISSYPAATTLLDSDDFILRRGANNVRISQSVLRRLFSLQSAPWNVAGSLAPSIPDIGYGATFAAATGNDYNASILPSGGSSPGFTGIFCPPMSGTGTTSWMKWVMPGSDPGDNNNGMGMLLTNAESTDADILASFSTFPSLVGTVQWMVVQVREIGSGVGFTYLITALGGVVGSIASPGAVAQGSPMYLGVNYATNEFTQEINLVAGSMPAPFTIGSVRGGFIHGWDAEPRVFADQPIVFSFGTDDGGKTPFYAAGEATPPVGVTDGKRYVVAGNGTFAGKTLAGGDIVEFISNATDIIVTPGTQIDVEQAIIDYLALNPPVSLLMEALQVRYCWGVRNSEPAGYEYLTPRGGCAVVGPSPSGDFSAMNPWSIAVYDGAGWVEYSATAFIGAKLTVFSGANTYLPGRTICFIGTTSQPGPYGEYDVEGHGLLHGYYNSADIIAPGVSYADVLNAGFIIEEPRVGGLTTAGENYPPPSLVDGQTIYVGGHEHKWYAVGGSLGFFLASKSDIAGTTSIELNVGQLILELTNTSGSEAIITVTDVWTQRFRIDAGETRRFLVIRRLGNSGGSTFTPLDKAAMYVQPAPNAGWVNDLDPVEPLHFLRNGDEIEIRGGITNTGIGTSLLVLAGDIPVDVRPSTERYFPVYVQDGSGSAVGAVCIYPNGQIQLLTPAVTATMQVRFSHKYNRVDGVA